MCLDKCRSPISFITQHWSGGNERWQAIKLGVHHGMFCVGCCWSLMLLMFAVGVGNLGVMLLLGRRHGGREEHAVGEEVERTAGSLAARSRGGIADAGRTRRLRARRGLLRWGRTNAKPGRTGQVGSVSDGRRRQRDSRRRGVLPGGSEPRAAEPRDAARGSALSGHADRNALRSRSLRHPGAWRSATGALSSAASSEGLST